MSVREQILSEEAPNVIFSVFEAYASILLQTVSRSGTDQTPGLDVCHNKDNIGECSHSTRRKWYLSFVSTQNVVPMTNTRHTPRLQPFQHEPLLLGPAQA